MQESVTYQAVLEEGDRARGQQAALSLLRAGIPIDLIIEASGLSIAEITQLKQANHL
jgi:predicted transposase YdaD